MFEHQPRERAVQCQLCGRKDVWGHHAICDPCIDAGKLIDCHSVCSEVARSRAARLLATQ